MMKNIAFGLMGIVLLFCTVQLGYFVERSDFPAMLSYYALFFGAYLGLFRLVKTKPLLHYALALAILSRLILVFSFPNFSDDVFRFIWDGRLTLAGINPFNYLPTYFMEAAHAVTGLTPELFAQLNSPGYYTIYPPVCQGIFAAAVWFNPSSLSGSAIFMKATLFAFEIGSLLLGLKLLKQFHLPAKNILIYALNPLIILEITGNLHFEGAMIFFFILAFWWLVQGKESLSALAFALSIASKLLPLIFLPFLIQRLGWKRSFRYFAIIGFALLLMFSPLLNEVFLQNFARSLDLYFQKFEFNASIYYLLREIGQAIFGYNLISKIGPSLGLIVLTGVLLIAWVEKKVDWTNLAPSLLFAFSLYLALTTTAHPWYLSLPLMLCIFTPFRFPILWSGLIFLTYINYSYENYFENLYVVGLEYVLVYAFFVWELFHFIKSKKALPPPKTT